jgi:tRNA dimethylallyltransferase
MSGMDNVIVITGPTAVGKTDVTIQLAKRLNGEIISADSMQVYKYMDIGTAKPTEEERQGIRHYLIDEVYPDEDFNVVMFRERALKHIKEILNKGKVPIVTGGTGLYIDSLVSNIKYPEAKPDETLREDLKKLAETLGNEYLHQKLEKIDPIAAKRIHVNDTRRIIRALEVFVRTGKNISYYEEESRKEPSPYRFIQYGLRMQREVLYERINKRVDRMMEAGLLQETQKLIDMGYENCKPMEGLGYKEMCWYITGRLTLSEAIELLKRNTRRYAKRQMTWFRRNKGMEWIETDSFYDPGWLSEKIHMHIASAGIIL